MCSCSFFSGMSTKARPSVATACIPVKTYSEDHQVSAHSKRDDQIFSEVAGLSPELRKGSGRNDEGVKEPQ